MRPVRIRTVMLAILFLGLVLGNLLTGVRLLRRERELLAARQQERAERARLLAINEELLRAVEQARLEANEARRKALGEESMPLESP